ncbi:MAG: hypothetical protein ABJ275_11380 [Maricaulaceae bacterium]
MQPILITLSIVSFLFISWWLWRDVKKQRQWREAKEQKIANLERKIAQKKAQALKDDKSDG